MLGPDISGLKKKNPKKTALMEYRYEEWKKKGKKYRITQTWIPLASVSPYLVKAVLIGEDDKFWSHEGFDYEAIKKAVVPASPEGLPASRVLWRQAGVLRTKRETNSKTQYHLSEAALACKEVRVEKLQDALIFVRPT